MWKPRCTLITTFSLPFSQLCYISIFPPWANYVGFWRLNSPHMATALLIATFQRTSAWQPACQNHHRNGEASRGEGWVLRKMCVCVCAHGFGGREARRKEKLARENKVNEAWRRLPSSVFGRSSRASSFTVATTPGARTENNSLEGCGGWWKNSQAVKGFCVFTWSGCGCWLRQHSTAQASNPLPVCLSRH